MRIRLGQYHWSASLAMTLLAGSAVGLFVILGAWQLQRAAQKAVLYDDFANGGARVLSQAPAQLEGDRYATVRVRGSYVAQRQVLIDNMTHAGRVGYQVLTPLRIQGQARWLLVNRGWVAASASRSKLPSIGVPADERIVTGKMDRLPRPGLRLPATPPDAENSWPRVMLFPRFADLATALEMPVYDYQLLLDSNDDDGFLRDWQPRVMGPEKHRAYAAQWFAFAVLALVLVVVVNLGKEQSHG